MALRHLQHLPDQRRGGVDPLGCNDLSRSGPLVSGVGVRKNGLHIWLRISVRRPVHRRAWTDGGGHEDWE